MMLNLKANLDRLIEIGLKIEGLEDLILGIGGNIPVDLSEILDLGVFQVPLVLRLVLIVLNLDLDLNLLLEMS